MTSVVPPYSRSRQLPSREISGPQWTNVPKEQQGSDTAVGGPSVAEASRFVLG